MSDERIELARRALVRTGYFTAAEIGDDIAPRITELASAVRALDPEALAALIGGEIEDALTWEGEAQVRVVGPWVEVAE